MGWRVDELHGTCDTGQGPRGEESRGLQGAGDVSVVPLELRAERGGEPPQAWPRGVGLGCAWSEMTQRRFGEDPAPPASAGESPRKGSHREKPALK